MRKQQNKIEDQYGNLHVEGMPKLYMTEHESFRFQNEITSTSAAGNPLFQGNLLSRMFCKAVKEMLSGKDFQIIVVPKVELRVDLCDGGPRFFEGQLVERDYEQVNIVKHSTESRSQ